MSFNSRQIILNNLQKALTAEERQGFTDTGVLGGFHAFLLGIIPRLGQIFPAADLSVLKKVAENYPHWSPLKRRDSFAELTRWLEGLQAQVDETGKKANGGNGLDRDGTGGSESNKLEIDNNPVRAIPQKPKSASRRSAAPQAVTKAAPKANPKVTPQEPKHTALQYVKGVGPERARLLAKLGLSTVEDLLLYYPRRYEYRKHKRISELQNGETATVFGRVAAGNIVRGRMKIVKLTIEQEGRSVIAVWFNQTYILKQYPVGTYVAVTGKVRWQQRTPEIQVTDIEKYVFNPQKAEGAEEERQNENAGQGEKIVPVYPETAQLSSKVIRSLLEQVLPEAGQYFPEILPPEAAEEWMDRARAHYQIHFPDSNQALAAARDRLVFEEILLLQLAVARLRSGAVRRQSPVLTGGKELIGDFLKRLPFQMTKAQQRVVREIFRDLATPKTMARLVQGDVGSGKTVVAMAALLKAVGSGYQGAMMAPTEILALQHFQTLEQAFKPLGVTTVLINGSMTRSERNDTLALVAEGKAQVAVGTHALIQDEVEFKALGLVITDEQHRFGVRQRSRLQEKGEAPHTLVMTATPIPRTLALTLYGDLQLSVLDEMPPGRKPVVTKHLTERGRASMERFLAEQLKLGRQVYVVCPLVEESEMIDTISATERTEQLAEHFPGYRVVLLHGRMKGAEKEEIMRDFQAGEIHILVSTTVVEVGVNVPNASVMVIEGAERFGLAQLHQLRGRVGRGAEQSYCILMSDNRNSKRLDVLCRTNDGFQIAEEDLKLRGPGELFGVRQHGLAELRLADLSKDGKLVEKAYRFMQEVMSRPEHYQAVLNEVDRFFPPEKIGLN